MTIIFAVIGLCLCAYGLGWSYASVHQLVRFRKKWSRMALRHREGQHNLNVLMGDFEKLRGQFGTLMEKDKKLREMREQLRKEDGI
jgi:hypothetical protein